MGRKGNGKILKFWFDFELFLAPSQPENCNSNIIKNELIAAISHKAFWEVNEGLELDPAYHFGHTYKVRLNATAMGGGKLFQWYLSFDLKNTTQHFRLDPI